MKIKLFTHLVGFLVALTTIVDGYSATDAQSSMTDFLRNAYCDILGVVRDEQEGVGKDFFDQHLSDLVSGRKTPSEIVTLFRERKKEHDANPLGKPCQAEKAHKMRLVGLMESLNYNYCSILGVSRKSNDSSYIKHLNGLMNGSTTMDIIEEHFKNWKRCNSQIGKEKYPLLGEKCSLPTVDVGSGPCPYESSFKEDGFSITAEDLAKLKNFESIGISFNPIGVKKMDSSQDNKLFCSGGYDWETNKAKIANEKKIKNDIDLCVQKAVDRDSSCFKEALIFKMKAMECNKLAFTDNKVKSNDTEACLQKAKEDVNALLQQKGCERRVTFDYHLSLDIDGMFTSPTYDGIQSSMDIDHILKTSSTPYRIDDANFLRCVLQASYSGERRISLDMDKLFSRRKSECNIHSDVFYQCWNDANNNMPLCTETFRDPRFNSSEIIKSLPEEYIARAKKLEYVPSNIRITQDNPIKIAGKSYWGFDYYFKLDTRGELVSGFIFIPTHDAHKTPRYVQELQFNEKTGELLWDKTVEANMRSVGVLSSEDSCSDAFEHLRRDYVQQNQVFLSKLQEEAHQIGCDATSEIPCDHIALGELDLAQRISNKQSELHGKMISALKANPTCINSKTLNGLVNIPLKDIFNTLNVSGSQHTPQDCTDQGGTLVDAGGFQICRFTGKMCPSGWTQHDNWSETQGVKATCQSPNIHQTFQCLGAHGEISIPGASKELILNGHSWANEPIESKNYYVHYSMPMNIERSESYMIYKNLCEDKASYSIVGTAQQAVPTVAPCELFSNMEEIQKAKKYNTMNIFTIVSRKHGNTIYALDFIRGASLEFSDLFVVGQKQTLTSTATAVGCK